MYFSTQFLIAFAAFYTSARAAKTTGIISSTSTATHTTTNPTHTTSTFSLSSSYPPSTTSLLVLSGTGSYPLVASVVAINPTATTYNLTCPATVTDCLYSPPAYITNGPSTFGYSQSVTGTVYKSYCAIAGTTSADCTVSVDNDNGAGIAKTHLGNAAAFSSYMTYATVTITGAVNLLVNETHFATSTAKSTSSTAAAAIRTQEVAVGAVAAVGMFLGGILL